MNNVHVHVEGDSLVSMDYWKDHAGPNEAPSSGTMTVRVRGEAGQPDWLLHFRADLVAKTRLERLSNR